MVLPTADPGLTAPEAAQRLLQDGPNVLASEQRRTWRMILRETLREPMFMLLLSAGTLYLTLGERQEGLVMFGLVLVVLSLTLYQEGRCRLGYALSGRAALLQVYQRFELDENAAAAKTHQWQGQPLGRQKAHVDAHVDQGLHTDPQRNALRDQGRKSTLKCQGLAPNLDRASRQPEEHQNDGDDTGKAQFFGDHCQQKIGMRLGKIKQFFQAIAQTDTKPFTAAKCNQRMRELIAFAKGIAPRIHETDDALTAILGKHDQQRKGRKQKYDQPEEQACIHAA